MDKIIKTFRETIKPKINEHLDIDAKTFQQQAIVITVTALESYLRDRYIIEKNKEKRGDFIEKKIAESKESLQNSKIITNKYQEKELNIPNVLDIGGQKKEIEKILQIRHIIVHRAGMINDNFCDRVGENKGVWSNEPITKYLNQNKNFVEDSIEIVENFVDELDKKFT